MVNRGKCLPVIVLVYSGQKKKVNGLGVATKISPIIQAELRYQYSFDKKYWLVCGSHEKKKVFEHCI